MAESSNVGNYKIFGRKSTAQIMLRAGPNPHASPPLDCPSAMVVIGEAWGCLMPNGWDRGKWLGGEE